MATDDNLEAGYPVSTLLPPSTQRNKRQMLKDDFVSGKTCGCRTPICLVTTVMVLLIGLFSVSLRRIEYYELGFAKARFGGAIDRSEVYEPGVYFLGPLHVFATYLATTRNVNMRVLNVFSSSEGDDAGTTLDIDVHFKYQVIAERLESLYAKVGLEPDEFVQNIVINTIKNSAVSFSADDYLTKRRLVESELLKDLRNATLQAADVNLSSFQVLQVHFPSTFYGRKLDAALQIQENLIEDYRKNSTLIRGETSVQVEKIENEASLIRSAATNEATLLRKQASLKALELTEEAKRDGLASLAGQLGITDSASFLQLDYQLKVLQGGARKYVNFGNLPEAKSLL